MNRKVFKITLLSSLINILLSGIKIFIGIIGKSQGLLADGIHSLTDLVSDIVVYLGLILGEKPTDSDHNYGHKKIETVCEIIVGLIIIYTALVIGYSSGKSIYFHENKDPSFYTIIAAIFSIIIKEVLFRITVKVGNEQKNSIIIANAWHHRSDSFSSIAVLIGLLISVFNKKLNVIDSYMGVIVGFIILKAGYDIVKEALKNIVDTAPNMKIQNQIFEILRNESEVKNYHKTRMRYIGNNIHIETHIKVSPDYSLIKAHDISSKLENLIKKRLVDVYDVTIHVEPDIKYCNK